MELTYASLTSSGPVRPNNEDYLGFWEPAEEEQRRWHGAVVIIADGVGGQDRGEVASQTAVETALRLFRDSKENVPPQSVLWDVVNAANLAVYDKGMEHRDNGRMATTLIVSIFRNTEVTVGHVGDSRAYVVQGGKAQQITADHTYAAMQQKLGLISAQEAARSEMGSVLMRTVGREPTVQVDLYTVRVKQGDYIVQCTDGVHQYMTEDEICEIVTHSPPQEACTQLLALAEKRGTVDNLTVQVVRIDRVEEMMLYRGLPIYREVSHPMSHEVDVGQTLDDRFQITELVSRSGMASIFKAIDQRTGETVAIKIPFMQFESDPAFFSRLQARGIDRQAAAPSLRAADHPRGGQEPALHRDGVPARPDAAKRDADRRAAPGEGRLGHRQPHLRGPRVPPFARGHPPRPQAGEHHALRRRQHPRHGLRHRQGGRAAAADFRRLFRLDGHARLHGPRAGQGQAQRRPHRHLQLGREMLYEMVTGAAPFEGNNPYAIMNARLIGDPVAPRGGLIPNCRRRWRRSSCTRWSGSLSTATSSAAAMKAELDDPEHVQLTGRCDRLRPPMAWQGTWHRLRMYVIAALVPLIVVAILYLVFHR